MPLVPAICTQCGAQIEVDNTHEAGICKHCGTAFITEKAINNYNSYVTNNNIFTGATIIQEDGFQKLLNAAEGYLKLDDLSSAMSSFRSITEEYPQKFEGWYGVWSTEIELEKKKERLTEVPLNSTAFQNAKKLALPKQNDMLSAKLAEYTKLYESSVASGRKAFNSQFGSFDIFLNHVKSLKKLHDACNAGHGGSEIYYTGRELIYRIESTDYDGLLSKAYEYVIIGYDSARNSFKLANNGRLLSYSFKDGGYRVTSRTAVTCNIQLTAEDYDAQNLYVKYNPRYSNRAQFYFKHISEDGQKRDVFLYEWYNNKGQSKSTSGCYIATCVYGSYDCPQVWTLRRFRDYTLDSTWLGRALIKFYYAISPILVKWFGNQKWFKMFWRKCLDNIIYELKQRGVEDTQYTDKY